MEEHSFTLKDAAQQPHTYTVTRHRGSEGLPLVMQVSAFVVEPIAAGLGPMLLGALQASGGARGASKGTGHVLRRILDNPEVLASLDLKALAGGVRVALLGLPVSSLYAILAVTNRDGKPLVAGGKATPAFDEAYAGNYIELGYALFEVAQYNGFFPELGTFVADAKKALATALEPAKSDESSDKSAD